MASKFISLSSIPELTAETINESDFILAASKNDKNLEIFSKIKTSELQEFVYNRDLIKLNIRNTYYPYLYEIYYSDYDYKDGIDSFESYRIASSTLNELPIRYSSANPAGCVSIHMNGFVGHNVDRRFDESVNFIVTTPPKFMIGDNGDAILSRRGTLGMSTGFVRLSRLFVNSKKYSEQYKLVPFYLTDGINDDGLCITMDALPSYDNPSLDESEQYFTTGTNPDSDNDLCALMVPRILLDKCGTIDEVLVELNNWNVWCPCIPAFAYEYAWTITDKTGRIVRIEIINNEFKVIEMTRSLSKPDISSNFYLWKYDGNLNNILIQNASSSNPINNTLTRHSRGLERYYNTREFINRLNEVVNQSYDLFMAFKYSFYSQAYLSETNPIRYSDFCNNWGDPYGDLTINSNISQFDSVLNAFKIRYQIQQNYPYLRLGFTMNSPYSVVYNLSNRTMEILCDECADDEILTYKLPTACPRYNSSTTGESGVDEEIVNRLIHNALSEYINGSGIMIDGSKYKIVVESK